jgi:hypothetical protein
MVGNLGRRRARMYVLQIEHPIRDFETWKAAFERFSDKRRQSGVRRHQIFQPADDENYVVLDLEFESEGEADAFLGWLRSEVWSRGKPLQPWLVAPRHASPR